MTGNALEGLKVLEFCQVVSGPYCTKLMADMGAEVIKIETPRSGDNARRRPPFPGDVPGREKSGLFLYLNTNKLGVTLDPARASGKRIFEQLVKDADVLVEDRPVGEMEKLGLGYDSLKEINPGLIMMSVTPYGRSGPYKDYKAYQLNIGHVSGQAYMLPLPSPNLERPPVKVGGHTSDFDPGLVAVVAILAAVYWKRISGKGQFIEMSKQEALISMQRVESVTWANDQVIMSRGGSVQGRMPGGVMPCKDGYIVSVTPEEHQWNSLMELLGNPDWSKQDMCKDPYSRSEHAEEITELISQWMLQHTKEEIYKKGQALSCPIAPLHSAEDMFHSRQLNERGFFVDVEHPVLGKTKIPSAAYHFSKTPWSLERSAPLLGEHNHEIYCKRLGYPKEDLVRLRNAGII